MVGSISVGDGDGGMWFSRTWARAVESGALNDGTELLVADVEASSTALRRTGKYYVSG
jgi:hypothetical protein